MDLRSQSEPPLKRLRMLPESFVPPWQYDSLGLGLKSSQEPFWGVKFLKNILSLNLKSMVCSRGPYIPLCANRQKPVFYFFEKWKVQKKKKDQSSPHTDRQFHGPARRVPYQTSACSRGSLPFTGFTQFSLWVKFDRLRLTESVSDVFFICLFFYFKNSKVQNKKTKTKNAPKKFECVEVQEFLTLKGFFRSPGIFMPRRVL